MIIDKLFNNIIGIYCIENTINGKKYVGSSKNVYYRLHKHKSQLKLKKHANSYLQNSYDKYGEDSFKCYVLEEASIEDRFNIEQAYIDSGEFVYNLNMSAEKTILNNKSKALISKSLKEGYANGTIQPTKTTSVKVYDINGDFIKTFNSVVEASRELKISCNQIQKVLAKLQKHTHMLQFRRSSEEQDVEKLTVNNIGSTRIKKVKEKTANKLHRPCELTNIKTGEVLNFDTLKSCADYLNVTSASLRRSIVRYKRPFKNLYIIKYATASQ